MASTTITASGLEGRYARALFELARDKKALDAVAKDIAGIAKIVENSPDFAALIKNPVVGEDALSKVVTALGKKARFHALTNKFLGVLVENGRLSYLEKITASFAMIVAQHRGEITAEITSAEKLTRAQETALRNKLKKSLGREISFDVAVDPALLGGLRVRVGSRVVDSSIRTKLDNLTLQMKGI